MSRPVKTGSGTPAGYPDGLSGIVPAGASAHQMIWSNAMGTVAQEMIDNLLNIPLEQRKTELIRINALMDVARQLAKQPGKPLVNAKATSGRRRASR